jgi:hypothetical protein
MRVSHNLAVCEWKANAEEHITEKVRLFQVDAEAEETVGHRTDNVT